MNDMLSAKNLPVGMIRVKGIRKLSGKEGMHKEPIRSGVTLGLEAGSDEWFEKIGYELDRYEAVEFRKPRYQYVIEFLMDYYEQKDGRTGTFDKKDMIKLFLEIETGTVQADGRAENPLFQFLVKKTQEEFRCCKRPEAQCSEAYIRRMILKFDDRFYSDAWSCVFKMSKEEEEKFGHVSKFPTIHDVLENYPQISVWKYTIHYLLAYYGIKFEGDEPEEENTFELMSEEIAEGIITAESGDRGRTGPYFSYLAGLLQMTLKEQGFSEKVCEMRSVRNLILNLTRGGLIDILAPGLRMTDSEIDLFLKRGLRQSMLDMYDKKEFLLHLVLCYHHRRRPTVHSAYEKLQRCYKKLEKELEADERAAARLQAAYPREISKTRYIADQANRELKKNGIFADADCRQVSETAEQLMTWHIYLQNRRRRTVEEKYDRLYREVCIAYKKEVYPPKETSEDQKKKNREPEQLVHGTVQVTYPAEKGFILPMGTRFYRLKEEAAGDTEANRVYFCSEKEEKFEPDIRYVQEINVRTITPVPEKGAKGNKNLPDQAELLYDSGGLLTGEIYSAHVKKAVKRYEDKKDKGIIEVVCALGTVIPEHFIFEYEDGAGICRMQTCEMQVAQDQQYIRIEAVTEKPQIPPNKIPADAKLELVEPTEAAARIICVRPVQLNRFAGTGDGKIEVEAASGCVIPEGSRFAFMDKNAIWHFETLRTWTRPDGETTKRGDFQIPVRACMPKPQPVQNDSLPAGTALIPAEDQKIRGSVYVSTTKTKMKRFRESDSAEKILCVKCSSDCVIPEGSVFEYREGEKVCRFRTKDSFENGCYLTHDVAVSCSTGQLPPRKDEEKEAIAAPSGSIRYMEKQPPEIVRIRNEKRIVYGSGETESDPGMTVRVRMSEKQVVYDDPRKTPGFIGMNEEGWRWRIISDRTEMESDLENSEIRELKIQMKTDMAYSAASGERGYAEGELVIQAKYGMYFPKGLKLECKNILDGRRNIFQTTDWYIKMAFSRLQAYLCEDMAVQQPKFEYREDLTEEQLLEGYEKRTAEMILSPLVDTDWLRETLLIDRSAFREASAQRKRGCLMTLYFLKFVRDLEAEDRCIWVDGKRKNVHTVPMWYIRQAFEKEVNDLMDECGLQSFYFGNRQDYLFMYLLAGDEPALNMRAIWAGLTVSKQKKKETEE